VSLEPPPLEEFATTSSPSAQRDTGETAREYPDLFAVVDGERSKVDVARTHAIVDQRRVRGKHDRAVGRSNYVVIPITALAVLTSVFSVGLGTDDDALPPEPSTGFTT